MTTVLGGNTGLGLRMDALDLQSFSDSIITAASGSVIRSEGAGLSYRITGAFQYDSDGDLIDGTVVSYEVTSTGSGALQFSITNFALPLITVANWIVNDQGALAFQTLMSGADVVTGGATPDLIMGYSGADNLSGGGGYDSIYGGTGNDTIDGGAGASYLRGDDGADRITGGSSFDDINGNMGDDTASGGLGDDWVVGGKDNDRLTGDEGDDIVYGNIGRDWCEGGLGRDLVRGGQDDDTLFGQDGDDWLSGDRGNDTITGGAGADIFHTFGDAGIDRVTDFNSAEGDRVQLDPGTVYTVSQVGADTVINMTGGGQMTLLGVTLSSLPSGWIFGA